MGRILVILNLLFALFVGGFLVVDWQTRRDWRQAYETLKKSVEVAKQNHQVVVKERNNHVREIKNQQKTIVDLRTALQKTRDDGLDKRNSLATETQKSEASIKKAELVKNSAAQQTNASLTLVAQHQAELSKKNSQIKSLGEEVDKLKSKVQEAESAKNTALDRNRELVGRVARLEEIITKYEVAKTKMPATGGPGKAASTAIEYVRVGRTNPPKVKLTGKVTKVLNGGSTRYAQIDLGSDDSLTKGHTLYVYRTDKTGTQVRYIGELEITDTRAHIAAGKMIPRSNGRSPVVVVGDYVTSNLNP